MSKLYILPLIDETAKSDKKLKSSYYSEYLALPYENRIRPMFLSGIKHFANDEKILPLSFATKIKFKIKIDGSPISYDERAVIVLDLPIGTHTIDLEGNFKKEISANRVPKNFKGDTNLQLNSHKVISLEDGDNFFIVTYKFKIECVKITHYHNGPHEHVGQERFIDVSHSSDLVNYNTFISNLYRYGTFEMEGISIPTADTVKAKKAPVIIAPSKVTEPIKTNATTIATTDQKTSVSSKPHAMPSYTNDEYFDVLVNGITQKNDKNEVAGPKKKEEKFTPLQFIRDEDPKYAELYKDGTLAYNTSSTVYVPRSVTKLNPYFLKDDKVVKTLVLPDDIEEICASEFCGSVLEELVLPKNLKVFKLSSIAFCPNLKRIYIDDANPYFTLIDDVLYKKNGSSLELIWYSPAKQDEAFFAPSNCTIIGYSSVSRNTYLKKAILENVTMVDMSAFAGCKKLEEVRFSKSLKLIGTFAFEDTAIKTASIPFSTKINSSAFPKTCKVKRKFSLK